MFGLLCLVVLPFAGCRANKDGGEFFSVMAYNVGVFSKYSESSMSEVAKLILESGVCLVALNELDSCNRRHDSYQLKEIADSLGGWDYHFASAFPYAGGAYGNGVLSRNPILRRHRITLPRFDGAEQRSCAVVETEKFVFASTHLDHKGDTARVAQVKMLNRWFSDYFAGYTKPVLLCGDMNCTPESEAVAELLKCWTQLSGTEFTYSSKNPRKCIDYIFALNSAGKVKNVSARVYTEAIETSDHLPVVVKLSY